MKALFLFMSFVSVACAINFAHAAGPSDADLPAKEDITIWSLQKLAQDGKTDVLEKLFNTRGVSQHHLPEGYAAGAGARVLFDSDGFVKKALGLDLGKIDWLTGRDWKGKIFYRSTDGQVSKGRNRIREGVEQIRSGKVVPMASFVTKLLRKNTLVDDAVEGASLIQDFDPNGEDTDFVILNYADPQTTPKGMFHHHYWQESALKHIQVYDVMVAVDGKNGPVYIGKTWLGTYEKDGRFHAYTNKLLAWFFLDFNSATLAEQQTPEHWDGSEEDRRGMDPLPTYAADQK